MISRLLIVALLLSGCGHASDRGSEPSPRSVPERGAEALARAPSDFRALRDDFVAWYLEAFPVRATHRGVQRYDDRLPSLDRGAIQLRVDDLLRWLAELEAIPAAGLEGPDRLDYAVLEFAVRNELLEWEEIRSWARDPRLYTTVMVDGLTPLIEHDLDPLDARVGSLRARMEAAPDLLADARRNLSAPPRPWTELAIEETGALVRYLEDGAAWPLVQALSDPTLPQDLLEARDRLLGALRDHQTWLEQELLPRSTGDFRLGRYLFERKVLYEQHIALSVPELARLNEEAIEETRQELARLPGAVESAAQADATIDSAGGPLTDPDQLEAAAREAVAALEAWALSADVVSIPGPPLPDVRSVPAYAALDRAWLAAPGPADGAAWQPVFYLPDHAPAGRAELVLLTAHHTVPGDLVRVSQLRAAPRLRQVLPSRSLAAGWSHYAEGLVLDAGFGDDDPQLRRSQLERVLQRQARWYAALHLHALDASLDDVVARFGELTGVDEAEARREALRAAYDPMVLAEGLGRVQLLELRNDYREHVEGHGEDFSLKRFHDALLELGLPIPLIRDVLIPLDDPPSPGPRALDPNSHGRDQATHRTGR